VCHVAAPEWVRSASTATCHYPIGPCQHGYLTGGPHTCHVAFTYWSTSAATPPDRDTWQPLVEPPQQPGATWHPPIGPRQQVGPTQAQVT
jgi:hypothetical protein